jgi:hypothetical protein
MGKRKKSLYLLPCALLYKTAAYLDPSSTGDMQTHSPDIIGRLPISQQTLRAGLILKTGFRKIRSLSLGHEIGTTRCSAGESGPTNTQGTNRLRLAATMCRLLGSSPYI